MTTKVAASLVGATACAAFGIMMPGGLVLRLCLIVIATYLLISPLWLRHGLQRDPFHPNNAYRLVLLATVVFQTPGILASQSLSPGTVTILLLTALSFVLAMEVAVRLIPPRSDRVVVDETGDPAYERFFTLVWIAGWAFRIYALKAGLLYGTFLATALDVTDYGNLVGQLNGLGLIALLGIAVFSPSAGPRTVIYLMAACELGWVFVSGSKAALVYVVVPLLLIYFRRGAIHWGRRGFLAASLIAASLLVVFPLVQDYRQSVHSRLAAGDGLSLGTVSGALRDVVSRRDLPALPTSAGAGSEISQRLNSAYFFGLLLERPDLLDAPASGRSFLPIALWWIPRALWPDKPVVSLGAWYGREVLGWSFGSRSEGAITIWGDALLSFGWPGVLVVELAWVLIVFSLYQLVPRFRGWGLLVVACVYVRMLLGLEQNAAAPLVAMQQTVLLVVGLRFSASAFKWCHVRIANGRR